MLNGLITIEGFVIKTIDLDHPYSPQKCIVLGNNKCTTGRVGQRFIVSLKREDSEVSFEKGTYIRIIAVMDFDSNYGNLNCIYAIYESGEILDG